MSATGGYREGMIPHSEHGKFAHKTILENPHLTVKQVYALILEEYPKYTENQLRMLIFHYALKLTKEPNTKTNHAGSQRALAAPAPKQAPGPLHTAIQSYHGRSRYLPAYYEL